MKIAAELEELYLGGVSAKIRLQNDGFVRGLAHWLVESSLEQRIHYTGAINGGMSGGPALDMKGRVYGVNVSLVADRQLVGFVVPAMHIPALLARAKEPLDLTSSAQQLRTRKSLSTLIVTCARFCRTTVFLVMGLTRKRAKHVCDWIQKTVPLQNKA